MKEIAIMTARGTETLFYDLLAKNSQLPIKELCKKIPRKMVYKYMSKLKELQEATGIPIFQRQATICQTTGLQNIVIERKCTISVEPLSDSSALIRLQQP